MMEKLTIREAIFDPKTRALTERVDLLKEFLDKLNPSRTLAGYAPLTFGRLAKMLEGRPTRSLYQLRAECDDAEAQYRRTRNMEDKRGAPWSAAFWTRVKPKKKS